MTQAAGTAPARIATETQLVAGVSAAHFVSHYYIIILPPLFGFVRADYGVSYIELGLALTAFNVVTALGQTPAGYLVDRYGPRTLLIGGLLVGAIAFALAGLVNSFWFFVAMFALAGFANTVYHPADYAMLSQHVAPERISRAFSIHTFAGMLGSTAAPVSLLLMQSQWGWRGAFIGAATLGLVVAIFLSLRAPPSTASRPNGRPRTPGRSAGACWSAHRSCSTCFCLRCSPWSAAACNITRWSRSASCTARRLQSRTRH